MRKKTKAPNVHAEDSDEMRNRIIEASMKYMKVYGSQKLSMVDVASAARVSRATVYNYFDSKEALIEAVSGALDSVFFNGLHADVAQHERLDDRAAAIAIFIRQCWTDQEHTPWYGFLSPLDEAAFLTTNAGEHTLIMMKFLRPYVQKARKNNEIRSDLDLTRTTEWIARVIMSFAFPPPEARMDDPKEIRRFFRDFLFAGLAPIGEAS